MLRYLCLSKAFLAKPSLATTLARPTQQVHYRSIMAEASPQQPPQASQPSPAPAETLPPLSGQDLSTYSRMAQKMELFHNSFRQTWKILYSACSSGKRPANMSIRQFLNTGAEFCHHLHMHHSIEEQHIFPVLATRMPAFRRELELLTQHQEIHKGVDRLEAYVDGCKAGKKDLRMEEMYVYSLIWFAGSCCGIYARRDALQQFLLCAEGPMLTSNQQEGSSRQLWRRALGASKRRSGTFVCGEYAEVLECRVSEKAPNMMNKNAALEVDSTITALPSSLK